LSEVVVPGALQEGDRSSGFRKLQAFGEQSGQEAALGMCTEGEAIRKRHQYKALEGVMA
jgi:hypothetical protein